jgi:hypothetical protein
MLVVMRHRAQRRDLQMSPTEEQHPVQRSRRTVATQRSAKAFARGARMGVRRIRMPSEAKIASKGVGEGGVPVAQQEPELLDAVRQVHEVTGLLGDPFPGWVGRHAEDVDPASGDLQHDQHLQALEQDGLSMEQVAGQVPSAWAARNCCQVRLARRTGDLAAVGAAMDRFTALSLHARPQLAARVTWPSGAAS